MLVPPIPSCPQSWHGCNSPDVPHSSGMLVTLAVPLLSNHVVFLSVLYKHVL
ncbi:hypothetical protein PISMIDRAFT_363569 [Pisolithus microcarpus 441]|uniref:Uncharacterized protein n=1 Tax=Pisolithus microcarpus 441 TaxID=765257 RepID=A0A0C9ZGI0_9AGAM|nr:hypothetical protein PISMIDRAFT_363569 [Pisolithus microcarpus 441]